MKTDHLQQAITTLNERQMASETESHISDIDPRALLLVTLVYLVAMLSVSLQSPGMLIWFAVYPIVTAPLAHVPYERIFCQSLYVLPLVVLIGIFNPLYERQTAFMVGTVAVSRGWVSLFSIVLRGLLSVQALLLLIRVAGFNRMCAAMGRLGVPRVLVTQLLMVYRYMSVLLQEALAMHRARTARDWGRRGYPPSMWGPMVGQLLLRSLERSRRINMAMKARLFDGSLPVAPPHRWAVADTVYCMAWIPVIIAMRFVDCSSLLLQLFKINAL